MESKVSICCLCYNHSLYIRSTLDSFISQNLEAELEIIIFDDCSTDNSREIINAYKEKHPNLIKTIFPEKNTYSQGKTTFYDMIDIATGDFIAFCEGDDYWIDDNKLQKQLNYLLANQDINIVFHPAMTLPSDNIIIDKSYGYYGTKVKVHKFEEVLSVSGGYMPMASIFARKSAYTDWLNSFPEFFSENMWHSTIQILGALGKGAGYLPEKMSIYRSMHEGSWTHTMSHNSDAIILDFERFIIRNRKLNDIFEREYEDIFDNVLTRRISHISKHSQLSLRQKVDFLCKTPIKLSILKKASFFNFCIVYSIVRHFKK